jgi:hypothetical protein
MEVVLSGKAIQFVSRNKTNIFRNKRKLCYPVETVKFEFSEKRDEYFHGRNWKLCYFVETVKFKFPQKQDEYFYEGTGNYVTS